MSAPVLADLVTLVRTSSFNDSIRKRCQSGASIGIRLVRTGVGDAQAEEAAELVLDFGCSRLTVLDGGEVQTTYFDSSRAAFVALAKRALPDDKELARLH